MSAERHKRAGARKRVARRVTKQNSKICSVRAVSRQFEASVAIASSFATAVFPKVVPSKCRKSFGKVNLSILEEILKDIADERLFPFFV